MVSRAAAAATQAPLPLQVSATGNVLEFLAGEEIRDKPDFHGRSGGATAFLQYSS
jgi:hypothetical protein